MSKVMYQKLFYLILTIFLITSCSKDEPELNIPADKAKSFEIYKEAVEAMKRGDYFIASKKFVESEQILPKIELSAKASLMSSYCLYLINFYPEATASLERFLKKYPANTNAAYAHYLIAIVMYEQILDERKDISPLLKSKEKIQVPQNMAGEMIPYDTGIGDFRVHYAGFFDPGFGNSKGSYAVLEVKTNEVPFILQDNQNIAKIKYERLNKKSKMLYGTGIKSNYQNQELKLSKHFLNNKNK